MVVSKGKYHQPPLEIHGKIEMLMPIEYIEHVSKQRLSCFVLMIMYADVVWWTETHVIITLSYDTEIRQPVVFESIVPLTSIWIEIRDSFSIIVRFFGDDFFSSFHAYHI